MKTKHLLILGLWISLMFPFISRAQSINSSTYSTAIGLRAGGTSGLTIKHFTSSGAALEGIIGLWGNAFSITGLYEKHANSGAIGLNWYYGGGGHIAASDRYRGPSRYYYRDYYSDGGVGLGIDGIVGLEYKITPIPFAISFDLKPFIEINTNGGAFFALDPGLGLKFAF
ncbi:MAG: hypothetical protein V4643_00560 [Bacteroidota bacterium]